MAVAKGMWCLARPGSHDTPGAGSRLAKLGFLEQTQSCIPRSMGDKHWAGPKDSCLPHILPDKLSSRVNLESLCSLTLLHLWCLDLISQDLCPPPRPPASSLSFCFQNVASTQISLFSSLSQLPLLRNVPLSLWAQLTLLSSPKSWLQVSSYALFEHLWLPDSCVVSEVRLPMASGFEQVINTVAFSYWDLGFFLICYYCK